MLLVLISSNEGVDIIIYRIQQPSSYVIVIINGYIYLIIILISQMDGYSFHDL